MEDVFRQNWPDMDEAYGRSDLEDLIPEFFVVFTEFTYAGFSLEGTGHAVTEDDYGRFCFLELVYKLAPTLVVGFFTSLEQAEAEAGFTIGSIAGPTEIPERDVEVWITGREHHIEPAVVLFALDQSVAEVDDTVPFAEVEVARMAGASRGGCDVRETG